MLAKTYCAAVVGLEATTITIEVNMTRGVMFNLSGMADTAVRESYARINAALPNVGYRLPVSSLTINLSPADIKKEGSSYDLPIAIGMLAAHGKLPTDHLGEYMMVGELGLDGKLKPIRAALPISIRARKEKFKGLIVPRDNAREAAVVNNLEVYGLDDITQVVDLLSGTSKPEPVFVDTRKEFYEQQTNFDLDYADVRGQENVKRALEVAAAGGHNLIMIGPPGSGKSMMAKRLPGILPPLSLAESLETTQVHSVAGKLGRDTSLISQRPFRSPHHTISQVGLCGGTSSAQPGEVSLAHNGGGASEIHRGIPLLLHVRRLDEPLPLRLLWRPHPHLRLHTGTNPTLHVENLRTAARPHRHPHRMRCRDLRRPLQGSDG